MSDQPPRLAEKLLEILIGTRDAEVIAGDLRESYQARGGGQSWYWGQVASCIWVRFSPHRRLIPDLNRDIHYAFRILRRNPGYAATAMLCLALGVGVNTVVFSWLDEDVLPAPRGSQRRSNGRHHPKRRTTLFVARIP